MNRIVLVDAKNLAFRAHYAFKELETRKRFPTSVIHGLPSLYADVQRFAGEADYVFVWDGVPPHEKQVLKPNWRKAIWPEYKGNRVQDAETDKIYKQLPVIAKFFHMLGYVQVGVAGTEADDLIGIYATGLASMKATKKVWVYSNDSDIRQLIGGKVSVISPSGEGGIKEHFHPDVVEKFGVDPHEIPLLKALAGDKTDNYKPVAGLGDKGAVSMVLDGVDPSTELWERLPDSVKAKYEKRLREHWSKVHACYQIAEIPRSRKDPRLSAYSQDISQTIEKVLHQRDRKMPKASLDNLLKDYLSFCNTYELDELIGKRRTFFEFIRTEQQKD